MPMPDCMFIPYNIALYGSVMSVVRGLHTNVVSFGLAHYWVFDRYKTDKNHNPRKGTETSSSFLKYSPHSVHDKNHNPRKGTETGQYPKGNVPWNKDKNHNPRKGTETQPFLDKGF